MKLRSAGYYAIHTSSLRGGKKKSFLLAKGIPDFFKTKAAKVFHVGCGKMSDTVVLKSDGEPGIDDVTKTGTGSGGPFPERFGDVGFVIGVFPSGRSCCAQRSPGRNPSG